MCCRSSIQTELPIIPLDQYSDYHHLKQITAWVIQFVRCCQKKCNAVVCLSAEELTYTENYWIRYSQKSCFLAELEMLENRRSLLASSCLRSVNPFIDEVGLVHLSGRQANFELSYSQSSTLSCDITWKSSTHSTYH